MDTTVPELGADLAEAARHPDPAVLAEVLRTAGPVVRAPYPAGGYVWVVTEPGTAREVLSDTRLVKDAALAPPHWTEVFTVLGTRSRPHPGLIAVEGAQHRRLRAVHAPAFTPRRIRALEPRIRAACEERLDRVAAMDRTVVDVVAEYCYPVPLTVIGELLGFPPAAHADLRRATEDIAYGGEHSVRRAGRALLARWVEQAVRTKRDHPGEDVISDLVAVHEADPGRLRAEELTAAVTGLIFAGHETTAGLLASMLMRVATDPEARAAATTDAGAAALVERTLQLFPPVPNTTWRFAAEPLTIAGHEVPRGAAVLVSLLAVNRCPVGTGSADRTPAAVDHMSFGHGPHYCIGAGLSRTEARIAVRALVERFPDVRLAVDEADLRWDSSIPLRRLRSLPVHLGADRAAGSGRAA